MAQKKKYNPGSPKHDSKPSVLTIPKEDISQNEETAGPKSGHMGKNNKFWSLHKDSQIAQVFIAIFSMIGIGVAIWIAISQRNQVEKFAKVDSSDWNKIFSHVNDEGGNVIGADQVREVIVSTDSTITDIDINNLNRSIYGSKPKWYVYGVWWYADIFGLNHWTRYCRYIHIADNFPRIQKI